METENRAVGNKSAVCSSWSRGSAVLRVKVTACHCGAQWGCRGAPR